MIKGLILRRGEPFYSAFGKLFENLPQLSTQYNWLISNPQCYPQTPDFAKILEESHAWLTGRQLAEMLRQEDFQWIWGVLSAFPTTVSPEAVLRFPLPDGENGAAYWHNPIAFLHPLAEVEFGAFDSSCTVFLGKSAPLMEEISRLYPLAEDLEEYNRSEENSGC